MSSTVARSITFSVPRHAMEPLMQNQWGLAVARSVAANGQGPSSNIVWAASHLAPNISVQWNQGEYALNWASESSPAGMHVSVNGNWQPASLGSSYVLDPSGSWQDNGSGSDRSSLTVRNQGSQSVHLVIGARNNFGDFDAIWIDPNATAASGVSTYQPDGQVSFWWGHDQKASVFDPYERAAAVGSVDPREGTQWHAQFIFEEGRWDVEQR